MGVEQLLVLDLDKIREDFPVLKRKVKGRRLVYLDNAATSQKPLPVIQAIEEFYRNYNANVHRGIHTLSEEATIAYEGAREKIAGFINARSSKEIIFTRGTTEGINLVSHSWGGSNIEGSDVMLLTEMEHHSNLVPWQLLAREKGARLEFVGIDDDGHLLEEDLEKHLSESPKLVGVTHVSNVLGTINPVKEMARRAHRNGGVVVVDAAQSVPHMPVDVQDLDCDFLAFSGHKMLGPTGIGVLYAKRHLLEEMEPFLGGGEMIREVHLREAKWKELPWKFEAGTPNVAGVIGLGAAVEYLNGLEMGRVRSHEMILTGYALEELSKFEEMKTFGPEKPEERGGVLSFNLGDIHPHDLATILDEYGIAIRSGHHCAQPLMERLGVPATSRASFYVYNTEQEVDRLVSGLREAWKVFHP